MNKMIAVCGSPNSGKTSIALKLAQEIYYSEQKPVLFVSPDITTPSMGLLFPNSKESDLYSMGVALDKTDIYREDVLKQSVTVKTMKNFALMGYKLTENEYSYPKPTEDKVKEFIRAMREIAEYIVVDCTCDKNDLVSTMSMSASDTLIQLVTPDIKCLTYYSSQTVPIHDNKVLVMNIRDNDLYLPTEEVKSHFKEVKFVLPYSRPLKQQGITGSLLKRLSDGKFYAKLLELAEVVI
ncbi:MAG: hypothetical protein PHY15_01005 [Eubacteriales bacterium]|nr:hypothetical protein [Eubacteriales bacterium]MDD4474365.1 hypothetical protein [Eubacteriales bacterium]